MTRLVLVALDLDKEFRVEADTSNYTTEGVLSVKCPNGIKIEKEKVDRVLS